MNDEFTIDWTSFHVPVWRELFQPYEGHPVSMLEIGTFEGRSAGWFLENVLSHPEARITCVDTFTGGVDFAEVDLSDLEGRFDRNVARHASKVTKIKGSSRFVLRELPLASFDIAYVDGSHLAADVLMDAVLVWDLVKTGGLILFDDYGGEGPGLRAAIDAFLHCMEGRYRLLHQGYQVALTRTE